MTRITAGAVTALSLLAPLGAAADRLDDLAWMSGAWLERKDGVHTEENWLTPRGGMLMAMNRTVAPSARTSFEWLRIELRDGVPVYLTSPGGRPAVEFPAVEQSATRIVFENRARDFPRRILYWREGEALHARIEGEVAGQPRSREWRFEPAK